MEAKQIIKKLNERGYNQMMIAAAIERSPSLVSKVIHRKAKSYTVANLISNILEMDINDVFPSDQYDATKRYGHKEFDSKVRFIRENYL